MIKPTSVDQYISTFPTKTQKLLKQLRAIIKKTAPHAEEVISYAMPAYKQNGILVYFAGYEHHIGFYPTGKGIERFKEALAGYKIGKGSIQFKIAEPLPEALIVDIVKFRVADNEAKLKVKKK